MAYTDFKDGTETWNRQCTCPATENTQLQSGGARIHPSPIRAKAHAGHIVKVVYLEIWLTHHQPIVAPDRQQGERSARQGRWLEAAKADPVLGRPPLA